MFFITKDASVDICVNLSANGSHNFPKSDTQLYFLARYPSKKSVILAIIKKLPATISFTLNPALYEEI